MMHTPSPMEVTLLLHAAADGDAAAADRLLPLVYDQLRAIAARRMADERAGHTLQATALVHEVYLKLIGDRRVEWNGKAHFYAAAAEAMRQILVDHARARSRTKRGGGLSRVPLNVVDLAVESSVEEVLALDEAFGRLAREDAEVAQIVRLRFFAGLTIEETAELLGVSDRTVNRHWTYARAWLFRELQNGPSSPSSS